MRRTLAIALSVLALPSSAALAHKHHRHHANRHACKHGYVKRNVKHRRGHRTVRRTICVKQRVKHPVSPKPTTPAAPPLAPAPVVKLHAHLDPTFTRDPSNPFKVTYAYSASATSETLGAALTEPAPLPEGVLNFYSDGLLACSINVGGTSTGGECPVEYKALGEHKATTIYTSGSTSATETSVEKIEPFTTSTALTIDSYEPLEHSEGGYDNQSYGGYYRIGTLTLSASIADEYGPTTLLADLGRCLPAEGCIPLTEVGPVMSKDMMIDGTVSVPVYAMVLERPYSCTNNSCEPYEVGEVGIGNITCKSLQPPTECDTMGQWESREAIENGADYVGAKPNIAERACTNNMWPPSGCAYADSEARATIQFKPEIRP